MHLLGESQQKRQRHPASVGVHSKGRTGVLNCGRLAGTTLRPSFVRYVTIAPKFQPRKSKNVTYCPRVSTNHARAM